MATEGSIWLAGVEYPLLADAALPSGRRGIVRRTKDTQPSDPGRLRSARWKLSGPIGQSRERSDGFLGHDYSDQLDTRYNDLLTSSPARNALTLTSGDDFTANNSAAFAGFKFGAAATKFGGVLTAADVTHIDEDRVHLFFHRGRISTQVDPSDWAIVSATTHEAPVLGAAVWKGKGYTGHGGTLTIRRRISVTSTGAAYQEALASTYAKEMTVGNDRLWMVKATADDSEDNRVFYSLDDLAAVSNSFVVGDDKIGATSIGTIGPFAAVGTQTGAFSFTDTGKPVRLQETLRGHRSANNGVRMGSLWGWLYICGDLGLEAWNGGTTVNPAGPESLTDFEGAIDGRPLTVFPWRDSLFCIYLTTAGHSYVLRGMFDDGRWGGNTGATGRPAWFPFRRIASTEAKAIFATSVPTNPAIVIGEDTNASYYTMGRRGRDIADGNYVFGTDGGTWFGSATARGAQMVRNVRAGKFITENCDANNTWTLAVSMNEGSYVDVGAAVTTNGAQTVRPVSGSVPLTTVSGNTIKPRLTQVAASSTAPPQIRGELEIVYDERPEQVEEVQAIVQLGQRGQLASTDFDALVALTGSGVASPSTVRLPEDDTDSYGFVASVGEITDIKGDGNMSATVTVHLWSTS